MESIDKDKTADFRCVVIGNPTPKIEWSKDGEILSGNKRMEIQEKNVVAKENAIVTSTIKIHDVKLKDAGIYKCTASNSAGKATYEASLAVVRRIIFEERPPPELMAKDGQKIELPCRISCDEIFDCFLSWIHNGTVKETRQKTLSLPLSIEIKNINQAGEYLCKADTVYKRSLNDEDNDNKTLGESVQTESARTYLEIFVRNACNLKPCKYGKCHRITKFPWYQCKCFDGFYGVNCQFYNQEVRGIQGKTTFDNSDKSSLFKLDVTCNFGSRAKNYRMFQRFKNGTTSNVTHSNSFTKMLTSPKRHKQSLEETDNLSFILCTASIGERSIEAKKQIHFYRFLYYGNTTTHQMESDTKWFINGQLIDNKSTTFSKIWNVSPGIRRKVVAQSIWGAETKSWDVIVCGYNPNQNYLLMILCVIIAIVPFLFVLMSVAQTGLVIMLGEK